MRLDGSQITTQGSARFLRRGNKVSESMDRQTMFVSSVSENKPRFSVPVDSLKLGSGPIVRAGGMVMASVVSTVDKYNLSFIALELCQRALTRIKVNCWEAVIGGFQVCQRRDP